jgi:transposase
MLGKAMEEGVFKQPPISERVMRLSALLAGLDWTRVHPPRQWRSTAIR